MIPSRVERAFLGTALHAPRRGALEALEQALIVVGDDGVIRAVHRAGSASGAAEVRRHADSNTLVRLGAGDILLPGFVDLHVHAPQWPQLGKALELPLEEWLQRHTFPLEARCADPVYAHAVYESLVESLLANGTTTAVYFASIHLPATRLLAEVCLRRGQRALIGRVAMDDPGQCPSFYRDASAAQAEADTREFIRHVRALPGNDAGLVLPVITPRFIPACTDDLLSRLGALAAETGCHVQTHCSESDWEHGYVLERCGVSDTTALAGYGLLTRHTILAHGNFIGDADAERIATVGAGIAHCPLSNVFFSDAVFPLRRMLERGVRVGLGTDIAGGPSPSILENARQAVIASRLLEAGVDPALAREQRRRPASRIDANTAFWLATAGGADALDLPVGLFVPGRRFDALVLSPIGSGGPLHLDAAESAEEVLHKIVHGASGRDIREVWVSGRRVHARQAVGSDRNSFEPPHHCR